MDGEQVVGRLNATDGVRGRLDALRDLMPGRRHPHVAAGRSTGYLQRAEPPAIEADTKRLCDWRAFAIWRPVEIDNRRFVALESIT
jgi:hypothetical protein